MSPTDLDPLTDTDLIARCAAVIDVPKADPPNSFVLHAPLELLARTALVPYVPPGQRVAARERFAQLAAEYEAAGEPVARRPVLDTRPLDELLAALVAAIAAGDLDDVDHLAYAVGVRATPSELRRALAGPVVASLAAAAHASILLYLFPRFVADGSITATILRGPARELARHPDWRLHWFEDPDDPVVSGSLADALLDVPMLGLPGSDFIFPIMNQAEESGLATKLLSAFVTEPGDARRVARELSRIAAWSMLQEPADYAPYGWSHCLTMPQAVMGIAGDGVDVPRATAVAATYVVGFRAALGQRALDPNWIPMAVPQTDFAEARADGPEPAAAFVWHTPDAELPAIVADLAGYASAHHDAHLVKYTLACFDAGAIDPSYRRLYLSAAASLSGWWAQHPNYEYGS